MLSRRSWRQQIMFGVAAVAALTTLAVGSAWADDEIAHEYTIYCAKCHGEDGRGDGVYAPKLHKQPRDFSDCATMAKISDATIVKVIEEGGEAVGLSNEMPSWQGALDDDEIAALARYVRGFCVKPPGTSQP